MLFHLRRQPADHPLGQERRREGASLVNSLFEDNAEFGFGFRLTADQHHGQAVAALEAMKGELGAELVDNLISAPQRLESEIRAQRGRVAQVRERLEEVRSGKAKELLSLIDQLVRRSVWIIGGDGWAYDIGSSGLDHVLASGRDVNVLVMDTEVYSNTGGQMSKSTPLGAVAKFAAGARRWPRRMWHCRPSPTATSMLLASPLVPTRSRRCKRCVKLKPIRARR